MTLALPVLGDIRDEPDETPVSPCPNQVKAQFHLVSIGAVPGGPALS